MEAKNIVIVYTVEKYLEGGKGCKECWCYVLWLSIAIDEAEVQCLSKIEKQSKEAKLKKN